MILNNRLDENLERSLLKVAGFYDQKKVGDSGPLGFRRSTDLTRLLSCVESLIDQNILIPGKSFFLDMGCGDGRVNLLFSYLVKYSVGIELDEWTLDEYLPLKKELESALEANNLIKPPSNISVFHGDAMEQSIHKSIYNKTGIRFEDYDIFYTYLTMYEEFSGMIVQKAKKGSKFMIYGLNRIMPRIKGLELLTRDQPMAGIVAVYKKL